MYKHAAIFTIGIALTKVWLMGCSPPNQMLVDEDFSPRERELIEEALEEWVVATDGGVDLDFTFRWVRGHPWTKDDMKMFGDHATMHRTTKKEKGYKDFVEDLGKHFAGRCHVGTDRWSIVISIPATKNERLFKAVVMHELGHYFAFDQTHLSSGLMAPKFDSDTVQACVDQKTLDLACQILRCGSRAKATCE